MRATGIVAVVVAALLAGACVPETKSFLSEPGRIDRRVLGTWYFLEDNGSSTVVDIRVGKDKLLRLVWLGFKPDDAIDDRRGPARWLLYSGFTTRLGGRRYINLQLLKANWAGRPPKRFIMRYWYSKKRRLRFAFMSTETVRRAIKSGKLAGRDEQFAPLITADRKSLIAFIRRHAKTAFEKPSLPMRRMARNRR